MSKKCTPLWREAHFEVKMYKTILGPLLEVEMSKKCTPLWRDAHFEVKMYKTLHVRATFGGSDVEKVHAVVARSTFRSENVQNTRGSDHFWRFRCRFAASLHYTTLHYTMYSTAFGKPAGHREVAPREFDVHSRWKPAREQKRQGGPENPKARRHTARIFQKSCGVGSYALHEIDVRSLLNIVRTDGIRGHNSPQYAASATSTFF